MKIIGYNISYFASELEIFDPWTTLMFLIGLGAHYYLLITFRHPQFGRGVMARSGNGHYYDFAQDIIWTLLAYKFMFIWIVWFLEAIQILHF